MTGISFSGNAASVTGGASMVEASKTQQELTKFQSLLDSVKEQKETLTSVASSQIAESGRLNGDYTSSFSGTFTSQADKTAQPIGAAANTLSGTSLNGEEKSFAQNMYEDMLYDELAVSMTKNAGFGLADQIYLELQ